MSFPELLDMNEQLTFNRLRLCPCQRLNALIRSLYRCADETIAFQGRIIDFRNCFNRLHDVYGSIPRIYKHRLKGETFGEMCVLQHIQKMLQLRLTVSVNVIDAIIYDPIRMRLRMHIDARHDTDTFNDALLRTAPLSANTLGLFRIRFRDDGIVEKQVSIWVEVYFVFYRSPPGTSGNPFLAQKSIELIMTPSVCVISKIRLREVLETR